jgi:hypothetical protein
MVFPALYIRDRVGLRQSASLFHPHPATKKIVARMRLRSYYIEVRYKEVQNNEEKKGGHPEPDEEL